MRQAHVAGEKMFVDYAGITAEVIDPLTGEIHEALAKTHGPDRLEAARFKLTPWPTSPASPR